MTKEQAQIALDQMGGQGKLKAMIGMSNVVYGDHGVSFKFKMSQKYNYCSIQLTAMDEYEMTLSKALGVDQKNIKEINGLYCDQLKSVFEAETGLYLSL